MSAVAPEDVLARLREKAEIGFVRKGVAIGLLSGLGWAVACFLIDMAFHHDPFSRKELWLLAPLVGVGIHDCCSLVCCSVLNLAGGKLRELFRTLFSRSGLRCCIGTVLGATLGMGGYLMALSLVGPTYTLPITSMFPAFAAVMAMFFLHERLGLRGWAGLVLCIAGVCLVVYTPPAGGEGEFFLFGIAFAFLAAFGWASEAVCVASSTDFADSALVLNIYYMISVPLYWLAIIPAALHCTVPDAAGLADAFACSGGLPWLACAGVVACLGYFTMYKAISMIGVSRADALNITYSLWGVLLAVVFGSSHVTGMLVMGIVVILAGVVFIIGNPRDLVVIRKTVREEK